MNVPAGITSRSPGNCADSARRGGRRCGRRPRRAPGVDGGRSPQPDVMNSRNACERRALGAVAARGRRAAGARRRRGARASGPSLIVADQSASSGGSRGARLRVRPVRIDLHTHSTASDGTDAPAEVVAAAARRRARRRRAHRPRHDRGLGARPSAAAHEHGVALVRGTEVSARAQRHQRPPARPTCRTRRTRRSRAELDAHARRAAGPRAADRRAARRRRTRSPGRTCWRRPGTRSSSAARTSPTPSSRAGVVPDRDAAFAHLLASRRAVLRAALRARRPPTPSRADPGRRRCPRLRAPGRRRPRPDRARRACSTRLADAGLAGLEVDHRDHSPAQRARLTAHRRPPRPAGHRVERLPRCREGQPAGGEPHRARTCSRRSRSQGATDGGAAVSDRARRPAVRLGLHHAVRDHGPARDRADLPRPHRRDDPPAAQPGRPPGDPRGVRRDRGVRAVRAVSCSTTCTSRCRRCRRPAGCCCCSSRWSC